ncbi:uncharacterized protein LOC110692034 [Chenopodium quinoa]|uniref:uncharacterized protein LOC110692034 n=1 Tax=Chenopodium quinoa TaxID=63459 RepID=UPI000B79685E|nr:uncharacterized protein LOC110692034 [Chenopodium quinoa]
MVYYALITALILELVADRDWWIWHSFFGMLGTYNDLNVLHRSLVFEDVLEGRTLPVSFVVNGHQYNKGYYLIDVRRLRNMFARHQEAARKDVERAFGVLQSRFVIIRKPSLDWDVQLLHKIMLSCIILHSMIVEDERDMYLNNSDTFHFIDSQSGSYEDAFKYRNELVVDIHIYLQRRTEIEDNKLTCN